MANEVEASASVGALFILVAHACRVSELRSKEHRLRLRRGPQLSNRRIDPLRVPFSNPGGRSPPKFRSLQEFLEAEKPENTESI